MKKIVASIVSHQHGAMVVPIIEDLLACSVPQGYSLSIMLTLNVWEDQQHLEPFKSRISIIENEKPLGFGQNNNNAFLSADSDFFIVINPDVRILTKDIGILLECLKESVGSVSPKVVSSSGLLEDSNRKFPTVWDYVMRVLKLRAKNDYPILKNCSAVAFRVDWSAGMFLLFPSGLFKRISGFDERYFLYMEDVDICRTIVEYGHENIVARKFEVQHDAQRQTLKSSTHLKYHIVGIYKYFSKWGWKWF